ncbi:hypothetical protein [Aureimonas sp. ME7]|uniref:hypothetical protein n=1 Tax=Aureimonas sp. ME7 TaxID=2744252 RepID=UPI0015F65830|nr:hypothetical protein [Aureimonas sp. ME7]
MSPSRRIERQTEKVRRLAGELRFELLLLQRLSEQDAAKDGVRGVEEASLRSLEEVYAAAILRRSGG